MHPLTLKTAILFSALVATGCASTNAAKADAAKATDTAQKPTALVGTWEGHIELPNGKLGFLAHIGEDGKGTVDIPDQGAQGLALSVVREEGEEVELFNEVPGANVVFKGRREGDTMRGSFTQRGHSFPFVLVRRPSP